MQGAIFDMDGLLFDSEAIFQSVWREKAEELGRTLDKDFVRRICGSSGADTRAVVREYYGVSDPDAFIGEVNKRVHEIEETCLPMKKGCVEILTGLKAAGYKLAVASASSMEMIERNLEFNGITELFDELVSTAQVKRGKPAPDVFLYAAERIGFAPEECYVFEDSLNGIRAGCAAGMRAVMIPDQVQPTEEIRAMCWGVFPDLSEALAAILGQEESV
ncbi:MAG: HAD family phosphatase [Lachnospiraceae bacterium]|nr:HAD family phosphatase [Lachnospiraceae bacterium]